MSGRGERRGPVVVAVTAAALGVGHAAVSAYWLAGGTRLLDTIGGEIEEWGRQRSASAVGALALVTVVKLVVGLAALAYAGIGLPAVLVKAARRRWARALGWCAAAVLTAYGGLLTAVGLAVEAGVVEAAPDADRHALAWHTYLWDPWFLAWGLALAWTLRAAGRAGRPCGGYAAQGDGRKASHAGS